MKPRPSRVEQRRGLAQLSAWAAATFLLCVPLLVQATRRMVPRFNVRTIDGWVTGLQTGTIDERKRAVLMLRESPLLPQIPCAALLGVLGQDHDLRRLAVLMVARAVRLGHCAREIVRLLDTTASENVRRAALGIIQNAGPQVRPVAQRSVLGALRGPLQTRADAVMALSSLRDTSAATLSALERAFPGNVGDIRAHVLATLVQLRPTCRWSPLLRRALVDPAATVRLTALSALADLAQRDTVACVPLATVSPLLHDADSGVRASAESLHARAAWPRNGMAR